MRRVGIVGVITALWLVLAAAPAAAHGIAGGLDLPVPLSFFVAGAGLVVVFSFVALAVAWPEARWQAPSPGRVLATWGRWVVVGLMVIGVAALGLVVAAGVFGEDLRTNSAPILVWVYLWLVLPLLGAVVGDLWRYVNPWRTLVGERERSDFPRAAENVGVYPAAIAFVVFMWLGLVPDYGRAPGVAALAAILYSLYVGSAVLLSDRERAFGSFDAFTPYNYLVGAIAPISLDPQGAWRRHGWLRRLPTVPVQPGLTLFVTVVIGSVTYDGLSASELWSDVWGTTRFQEWFGTVALLATIGAIWAMYRAATWVAARMAGLTTHALVAESFAHVLVPVGLAYAVTHYFTVIAFEGQMLISIVSDPLGLGDDYFGTALREVELWIGAIGVWYIQLGIIIVGHVAAAVLVHDRALAVFPKEHAVRSQYPMLVLIVALSSVGLFLLSVA
ncbi:MAG: hypothetical protein HKN07_15970 [Acidimicrobiia bacterium]|nr:hypothetical protein [Acidimicrobiia bacterium]